MIDNCNGFVASGIPTFMTYHKRAKEFYNDPKIDILFDQIIKDSIKKYLFTFGFALKRNKETFVEAKYEKSILSALKRVTVMTKKYVPDAMRVLDSGGFQVISGFLKPEYALNYMNVYHKFLVEHSNEYDLSFCLDFPPSDAAISDFEDIKKLNTVSYNEIIKLPTEIQNKMSVVYHFEDPLTNEYWYNLLFGKDKLFYKIQSNNWSVGGMVGGKRSDANNEYIIYGLGLYNLVRHQMLKGINYLNFHILGVSAYMQIFFMQIIKKYLKLYYDFTLNITYDSSATIAKLNKGRYIHKFEDMAVYDEINFENTKNNSLYKIFFFKQMLNDKYRKTGLTRLEHLEQIAYFYLNKFDTNHNIKNIDIFKSNGSYQPVPLFILAMYDIWFYDFIIESTQPLIDDIFLSYDIDSQETYKKIMNGVQLLNKGDLTNKTKQITTRIVNTLKMFSDFESEDKANHMIDVYLKPDIIKTFDDSHKNLLRW